MKVSGIIREIDELGRIVIPKEIRDNMGYVPGTRFEIFLNGRMLCLNPSFRTCVFCGCGEEDKLEILNGRPVCKDCINDIKNKP